MDSHARAGISVTSLLGGNDPDVDIVEEDSLGVVASLAPDV
jgi:hypothetical protein